MSLDDGNSGSAPSVGLRIVHVTTSLQVGGAESMLARLVTRTPEVARNSLVVCLGPDGPLGARMREAGATTVVLGLAARAPAVRALWKSVATVRQHEPAIIQGWMYHGNVTASLLRLVAARSATLLWNIRCTIGDFPRSTRWVLRSNALLSALPAAVIFNSEEGLRQHVTYGFRPRHAVVLPNGFDLGALVPNETVRCAVRERLGVDAGELVIGMVARYHAMKDFGSLVKAARILTARDISFRLLLAGPNVDAANRELSHLLDASGLSGRVLLLGEVSNVAQLYPALDLFCLSSAWGEGFPNVLGEAMACGVPCVATDVGDVRQIIADTGLVVPAEDPAALARALEEMTGRVRASRAELSHRARARMAACYDIQRVADDYDRLYVRVLERP
jgi:glycosyltransferase involved in cell wall biosynthesis